MMTSLSLSWPSKETSCALESRLRNPCGWTGRKFISAGRTNRPEHGRRNSAKRTQLLVAPQLLRDRQWKSALKAWVAVFCPYAGLAQAFFFCPVQGQHESG